MSHRRASIWLTRITALTCSLNLVACTPAESIPASLQEISHIITAGNANNDVHYALSYDANFPCNVTLEENWQDTEIRWHPTYRFDLTDIETNTFVQSKSGRRAIIYSGYKQAVDGEKKLFNEIRINNIRYRAKLPEKQQQKILDEMNTAIAMCEEKYSF